MIMFCIALVAKAFVIQKTIDPNIMLSESLDDEADKAQKLILQKGKMPKFKYLLLWAYRKKCPLSSMDVEEAQRIIKFKFKKGEGSLLVFLLNKIRDLLQDKRNKYLSCESKLSENDMVLSIFYLNMIDQLKVLEVYVEQALDTWSLQSITAAVEACLIRGWCGDGDMCSEYSSRFLQFKPLANEKLEECQNKIANLTKTMNSRKRNYDNKNKYRNRDRDNFNDYSLRNGGNRRGRGSRGRSRGGRGGRNNINKTDRTPVPYQGGPGTPPPNECIDGTQLRKVYYFCDKFQINACIWGDDCRYVRGHFCSFCGGPKHGRLNCKQRPAAWA